MKLSNEFMTLFYGPDGKRKIIMRLSDKKLISVGDWFYSGPDQDKPNIILEFKYVSNGSFRVFGTNSCVSLDMVIPTDDRAEKHLLDGNEYYSWDKVWGLHKKSLKRNYVKYGREEDGVPVYSALDQPRYHWFKSMQEAEQYIFDCRYFTTTTATTARQTDSVVDAVVDQFKQRSEAGIKKYNTTLDRTDLSRLEWLQHLQEELMDATIYIEKLKTYERT
jgi:hypothetical protein